jgi:hypothetical protein
MTDNRDSGRGGFETHGKFTDEEFTDGSHTPDRAAVPGEEGEYTDSEHSKTDSRESGRGGFETHGKFTDEEFKDGSHTPDRSAVPGEEGEYTDSEHSKTDKDGTDRHD